MFWQSQIAWHLGPVSLVVLAISLQLLVSTLHPKRQICTPCTSVKYSTLSDLVLILQENHGAEEGTLGASKATHHKSYIPKKILRPIERWSVEEWERALKGRKRGGENTEITQGQTYQRILYDSKTFLDAIDVYQSSIDPNLSNHKADRHLYAIRHFNAPFLDGLSPRLPGCCHGEATPDQAFSWIPRIFHTCNQVGPASQ